MLTPRRPQKEVPVDTQMKRGFSRDKPILALQRAIKATFDDGQWQELGCLVGKHDVVVGHGRLLRSLRWGDEDYGGCIFDVLPALLGADFENLRTVEEFVGLREWLRQKEPKLYAELYTEKHYAPWVRSRQEQLEADLANAWSRDPLVLLQTGVHQRYTERSGPTTRS